MSRRLDPASAPYAAGAGAQRLSSVTGNPIMNGADPAACAASRVSIAAPFQAPGGPLPSGDAFIEQIPPRRVRNEIRNSQDGDPGWRAYAWSC